jgi:hypothetical protein
MMLLDRGLLLGRDAPHYRASNFPFSVEVINLSAVLPTL